MNTYYLKSGGDDNAAGASSLSAWATVAKINTESSTWTTGTSVIIDTTSAPYIMDEELIVRDGMTVIGVGGITIARKDKDDQDIVVSTTAADLRPYKVISTFTQPDSETYPNVWTCADSEVNAVLFRFAGWSGNSQPLIWLNHILGASVPLADINTTEDSYWSDASAVYFYSETDPNTDDSIWVRTQPSIFAAGISVMGGGTLENVAIGGITALPSNSATPVSGRCVRSYGAADKQTTLRKIFGYCGSTQAVSHVPGETSDSTIVWEDVRAEQGPPVTGSQIPIVIYGGGGSGSTFAGSGMYVAKTQGLVGSTDGQNSNPAISSVYFHNQGTGAIEYSKISISDANFATLLSQGNTAQVTLLEVNDAKITNATTRSNSTWNRCLFSVRLVATAVSGLTTVLSSCRHVTVAAVHGGQSSISGNYSVLNCVLDGRGHTGQNWADNCYLVRDGILQFTAKNNVVMVSNDPYVAQGDVKFIRGIVSADDTLNMDCNVYVGKAGHILGENLIVVQIGSTQTSFAALQSTHGQESHGRAYGKTSASTALAPVLSATTLAPDIGSILIGTGDPSTERGLDYAGNPQVYRADVGAYEAQYQVAMVASDFLGRAKYNLTVESGTTWADFVVKAPAAPELIAADTDSTLFTAGVPNELTNADLVAIGELAAYGDETQYAWSEKQGLIMYDEAISGKPYEKLMKFVKTDIETDPPADGLLLHARTYDPDAALIIDKVGASTRTVQPLAYGVFNGTSDRVNIGVQPWGDGDVTIKCKFILDDLVNRGDNVAGTLFGCWTGVTTQGYSLYVSIHGTLTFSRSANGTSFNSRYSPIGVVAAATEYSLALHYNSSTGVVTSTLNGSPIVFSSGEAMPNYTHPVTGTANDCYVGKYGTSNYYWKGKIWDVEITGSSTTSYPHPTKTGATAATWFDTSGSSLHGTATVADVDAHCGSGMVFGSAHLNEKGWSGGENLIPNSHAVGGAVGTFPTGWRTTTTNGVAPAVVASGDGYVDVQFSGTATADAYPLVGFFTLSQGTPAVSGDTLFLSTTITVISGLLSSGAMTLRIREISSAGATLATYATGITASGEITATGLLTNASTAFAEAIIVFKVDNGNSTDLVVRISQPQLTKTSTQLPYYATYGIPTMGNPIPALTNGTADALGNPLGFAGRAKYNVVPVQANCATLAAGTSIAITGVTGATILSKEGTGTVTIGTNVITRATDGTLYNLKLTLADESVLTLPLSEGAGVTTRGYSSDGTVFTGTITAADIDDFWAGTQDTFFHGLEHGCSDRENLIPNSHAVGASTGVSPTGWTSSSGITSVGITRDVVGAGDGYVDWRIHGTASGNTYPNIEITRLIPAVQGDEISTQFGIDIVSGSFPAGSNPFVGIGEFNGVAFLNVYSKHFTEPGIILFDRTVVGATATHISLRVQMTTTTGTSVNLVLRLYQPQVTKNRPLTEYVATSGTPIPWAIYPANPYTGLDVLGNALVYPPGRFNPSASSKLQGPEVFEALGANLGPELITNGTFDTNTAGWTDGTASDSSVVNGVIRVTNSHTTSGHTYQVVSTVVGKRYAGMVEFVTESGANLDFRIGSTGTGSQNFRDNTTNSGVVSFDFVATSATTYITLLSFNTITTIGSYTEWDNISLREVYDTNQSDFFDIDGTSLAFTYSDLLTYLGDQVFYSATRKELAVYDGVQVDPALSKIKKALRIS